MKKKLILKRPVKLPDNANHNTKRREKYEADGAYRETLKANARKTYRQKVKKEISSCLRSLDFYTTMLKDERVVLSDGSERVLPVMNLPTTASVLQKRYQTIWRWVKKGMIPEPVLTLTGRAESVYHSAEVRILIEEIGQLEKKFAYYCKNHTATQTRIFALIRDARKQLNIGD